MNSVSQLHKPQPYLSRTYYQPWPCFLSSCIEKKNSDPGLPIQTELGSLHVEVIRLVKLSSCTGKRKYRSCWGEWHLSCLAVPVPVYQGLMGSTHRLPPDLCPTYTLDMHERTQWFFKNRFWRLPLVSEVTRSVGHKMSVSISFTRLYWLDCFFYMRLKLIKIHFTSLCA